MTIVTKINNNAAIARDARGRECVVLGRGVGFPQVPYELEDESVIQRRFYEFDSTLIPLVASLSEEMLNIASEIVQEARTQLNCRLNPNLPFTLADHLTYALARAREGIVLEFPLVNEIEYVYPREVAVGQWALGIVERSCGVVLPADEATAIALHLVNAEGSSQGKGDMDFAMKSTEIIDRIIAIVESCIERKIDRQSYNYMRFVMHLRFLIARLMGVRDDIRGGSVASLLPVIKAECPAAVDCAVHIVTYLEKAYGWVCSDNELFYLILHSNQFITGQ